MSRIPIHRKRRIIFIWAPLAIAFALVYFASYFITPTLNGLGLLAMVASFGAGAAAVREGKELR